MVKKCLGGIFLGKCLPGKLILGKWALGCLDCRQKQCVLTLEEVNLITGALLCRLYTLLYIGERMFGF